MIHPGEMNFKRKTPRRCRFKSKRLESRRIAGWEYGGGIAREIASRIEFRDLLHNRGFQDDVA